jgi:NAD(P)-dependent dehydrogenase (short-subunit alcohol dehydrogenase family)
LGPFLFTKLLLPRILESQDKRIVNLSSNAHFFGGINWADVTFGKGASYTSVAA